jgi:hypothetical protein
VIQGELTKHSAGVVFVVALPLLAGCAPLYAADTHISGTPKPQSFDVAERVAAFDLIAPASLQGLAPLFCNSLAIALKEARPPIRATSFRETGNLLNDHGLTGDYAKLVSSFAQSGVLEHEQLQRIGVALSSRYVLLPGLAEFEENVIDRFETMGLKVVRNRVTTIRLWLELWDTKTGQNLWESSGEITVVTAILAPKRTVPLDTIAQRLWLRMIQDGLLGGQSRLRILRN